MLKFILIIGLIALCSVKYGTSEVCYGDLGCFRNDGPFFNLLYRPISVIPWDPIKINTTFTLYTRNNVNSGQPIYSRDLETIKNSDYNSTRQKTYFITHGFGDSVDSSWIQNVKEALLNVSDVNVILVDWSPGAVFPYAQATANTRLVGREIGNFLRTLKDSFFLNLDKAHIIGHSVGAHIAGYAGKWLNDTKLGRITGLDPAGPFFQFMPDVAKLVPSDAKFVDAIHTDGSPVPYTSFGSLEPNGHADFYPDGGYSENRCRSRDKYDGILSKIYNTIKDRIVCLHFKAADVYLQSIVDLCPFTAFACDDIKSYEDGKCTTCRRPGHDCIQAGYNIDKYDHTGLNNTKFYFTTTDIRSALCFYHWAMDIRMNVTKNLNTAIQFLLFVRGQEGTLLNTTFKTRSKNVDGIQRFILNFDRDPIQIDYAVLSWSRQPLPGFSFRILFEREDVQPLLFIKGITFTPIDRNALNGRTAETTVFCDEVTSSGIPENTKVLLTPKMECIFDDTELL